MAIKFENISPGMVLLDIHKHKMGNTRMSELGAWEVRILSVDPSTRTAMCSWNNNPPTKWFESRLKKLHAKPTRAFLEQQARRRISAWR